MSAFSRRSLGYLANLSRFLTEISEAYYIRGGTDVSPVGGTPVACRDAPSPPVLARYNPRNAAHRRTQPAGTGSTPHQTAVAACLSADLWRHIRAFNGTDKHR